MRIEVTAGDIAAGKRKDCLGCPIAVAARRCGVLNPSVVPSFVNYGAYASQGGNRQSARLPAAAQMFIEQFDDGEAVTPFAFDLDVTP